MADKQAYYQRNRESVLTRVKARYWAKRDEILAYHHQPEKKRRKSELDRFRRFGITLEQLEVMAMEQGNACAICGKKRLLIIDHDHASRIIRGLLCRGCNSKLGWLENFNSQIAGYLDNGRLSSQKE